MPPPVPPPPGPLLPPAPASLPPNPALRRAADGDAHDHDPTQPSSARPPYYLWDAPWWDPRDPPLVAPFPGPGLAYPRDDAMLFGRSPEWDDRRKRRRSMSPPPFRDRDRDRRDSSYADRPPHRDQWNGPPPRNSSSSNHSSNNNNGYGPPSSRGPSSARLDPPSSLPYLVTPTYFASFLRQTTHPASASADPSAAYKQYRAEFLRTQYRQFFDAVRETPWFRERYSPDPAYDAARAQRRRKGRDGRVARFVAELQDGTLDTLSLDYADFKATPPSPPSPAAPEGDTPMAEPELEDDPTSSSTEPPSPSPTTTAAAGSDLVPLSTSPKQLLIKAVSPDLSRAQLEEHCAQVPGFDYLALTEPNPAKNLQRVGWATFKDPSDLAKAAEVLCESTVANFTLHMVPNLKPVLSRVRTAPGVLNIPARIAADLESVRKAVAVFEKEEATTAGSEAIEAKDVSDKKKLDLYLHYLRAAFHTCYYCVLTCDFAEELERKCPKHLRRDVGPAPPRQKETEVVTKMDEKLPLLVDRGTVDPGPFGGDSPEEEMHRICQPKIKQEEEGKFRCNECKKLFSALKFIEKHIATKHPEIIGDKLEKLKYFNNFVLDPSHPPHGALESVEPPPPPRPPNNSSSTGNLKPALSDRLGEFVPGAGGGPAPPPSFAMGGGGGGPAPPMRNYDSRGPPPKRRRDDYGPPPLSSQRGPPPPPPPGAVIDPRARKGASSYADLDGAPAGVGDDIVALPY